MKFIFEFLYSFRPTHARKIETEMISTAFNNIYIYTSLFTVQVEENMHANKQQEK